MIYYGAFYHIIVLQGRADPPGARGARGRSGAARLPAL